METIPLHTNEQLLPNELMDDTYNATELDYEKIYKCFQLKTDSFRNRFIFYSRSILRQARCFADLEMHRLQTDKKNPFRDEPFWLDILDPTAEELAAVGHAFDIHPLTIEDIQADDTREKCDVFPNYYFVSVKSIVDDEETIVKPVPVSIVVCKHCILSIQYTSNVHTLRAIQRFKTQQGRFSQKMTPDFICYSLLDEITDAFLPITRFLEHDMESIDDLVAVLKASEQTDMLKRITISRKRVIQVSRLMSSKPELIKLLVNRMRTESKDILIFLEDIYDHAVTMKQDLIQYEKALSRSYSNYLAQISIEIAQVSNRGNEIAAKMTMIASILLPMTVITGTFWLR
jgi:Mg2+ and Co2+ transporter CorA